MKDLKDEEIKEIIEFDLRLKEWQMTQILMSNQLQFQH